MKKLFLFATAALMMGGVVLANGTDKGKKKKCAKGKTCNKEAKAEKKSCCSKDSKTAKM